MWPDFREKNFIIGDLVYYFGYQIFESDDKHMGIIVGEPEDDRVDNTYYVFWFESSLTTLVHCDNMILVYERDGEV